MKMIFQTIQQQTSPIWMKLCMASAPSKLLVSDVYMDSQTEEETELEHTGIDDVIISDSD